MSSSGYATPYPPQHPFSRADQAWIDHIQAASQGALRIDSFWSGVLSSADQSLIELRHGVAHVAPLDALRSLHVAEVAHHFTSLAIPRGAYPARAIRSERLRALPAPLQALITDSGTVWEAALARELSRAQTAGKAYATEQGIRVSDFPEQDQLAFNRAYSQAARVRAHELRRLGVDGEAMFGAVQGWVSRKDAGFGSCAH